MHVAICNQFGSSCKVATAVMLAESHGNTHAISRTNDYGLFQINLPSHPQYSATQLLNWHQNIKIAYKVSNGGTNWNPWTTFWTGSYLAYY